MKLTELLLYGEIENLIKKVGIKQTWLNVMLIKLSRRAVIF